MGGGLGGGVGGGWWSEVEDLWYMKCKQFEVLYNC